MVTIILLEPFDRYYMPFVEMNSFNALIDNKPFFDHPVKNKQEAYEKRIKMSQKDECTTGNLLDFSYHQNYYKLIGIDLSIQTNANVSQQINFKRKLVEDADAAIFFIAERQHKQILSFSLDSLIDTE